MSRRPLMRIPYTSALPPARIVPSDATDHARAVTALKQFLSNSPNRKKSLSSDEPRTDHPRTVLLTGAGISVPSGLSDYRGPKGTYRTNPAYRSIYYHEFVESHESRKRYWARSFLGWPAVERSRPNAAHHAVAALGALGFCNGVITQNVDSFHPAAHPALQTVEIHGALRTLVCIGCRRPYPRTEFQRVLAELNPAWAQLLREAIVSGADEKENPVERAGFGIKTNPDGDVDLPGAPYTTFRYPACPRCMAEPRASGLDGGEVETTVDTEGGWTSGPGILKPGVIMFGESVNPSTKESAQRLIDEADQLLVIGSSLATMSALGLVRKARASGKAVGVVNLGGVREETEIFKDNDGGVRLEMAAEKILPAVVEALRRG